MSNARYGLRVRNGLIRSITEGLSAIDADAGAFISAAGITDLTQQSAIIQLVSDLKTYGLWTKMKAIYPIVGGTASAHKFNLKDPRDLDAAFRLVFNGGWTHSSNGALPNGTNGWANTFCNPNNNLTNNDIHLSYYSRSNTDLANSSTMGCDNATSSWIRLVIRRAVNTGYVIAGGTPGIITYTITDSRGLFIANVPTSSSRQLYRNNSLLTGSSAGLGTNTIPNFNIALSADNSNGSIIEYDNKECAFASIGSGLTNTEAADLYTTIQAFQTTLGRQV